MADKKRKETETQEVEAEEVSNESADDKSGKEKKEGAFSKWWSGVKKNISDAQYESALEREWSKKANTYRVYGYSDLLFKTVEGVRDGETLTVYGDKEIKDWSVVVSVKSGKAYYCAAVKKGKLTVDYDGKRETRPATVITLDDKVKQVKVIRAGDKYYEYKGNEE